jgi:hypothetical protein
VVCGKFGAGKSKEAAPPVLRGSLVDLGSHIPGSVMILLDSHHLADSSALPTSWKRWFQLL